MSISLPLSLQRQFRFLERRLWQMDALSAFTGAAGSLLLSFFFLFASDRFWDTPQPLRTIFALAGWSGFAFFAWQYGTRWIWGRRSIRTLAVIVQKRYRRLGDRLLGIVELADSGKRPANFSPELCRAAIEQVASEAASIDFRQAVATRNPRRSCTAFLILAAFIALPCALAPQAGWNALLRWLWPPASISRYTFVTLLDLPDHLVVAQGEPFDISVGLAEKSFWRPQTASSHFEGQPPAYAPIRQSAATFHLPGQTETRRLWLTVGDVTRQVSIEPTLRPDLRQLRARLELPAYLRYPPQEERIEGGTLSFLPGTNAVFTGETVRTLNTAQLQGEKPVPLKVEGGRFHTAPMLLELERALAFTWKDTFGLAAAAPALLRLTPREDAPPDVDLRGLEAAIAVLPGEVIPIDLSVADDFGVQRIWLQWQTAAPSPDVPAGAIHEIPIGAGQPQLKSLAGHFDFSAALLEIPADTTVLLRGAALDYFPDRTPAITPIYRIHVLSPEAHARLVHDELEKLQAQLEELTRKQEALLQSAHTEKTDAQAQEQIRTAEALQALAEKTAATLKEAMRNPQITPATLQEWGQHAQAMHELATAEMPAAAQSLASGKVPQAVQQEKSILEKMRAMEKQTNDSLEKMMARTLAARMRRAAATEDEIARTFQKMVPDTIGLTPAQLAPAAHHQLNGLTSDQTGVTRESGRLHEEISRLFDRTSLARYGDVAADIEHQKAEDALGELGGWMQGNRAIESIASSQKWGSQLRKWADRLADDDQKKSAATGKKSGQAGDAAAQMQALLAMLRLRQTQEQLRDQTSALDSRKTSEFPAQAQELATAQSALHDELAAMPFPPEILAAPGKAMADAAARLAKPDTGKPTRAAQTDALNLLDAAIAQLAGKSGASMQSLMAMMGAGAGTSGGMGSTAGGAATQPDAAVSGPGEGDGPEARAVQQSVGLDRSTLPAEFRDAIENYHRALEQSRALP